MVFTSASFIFFFLPITLLCYGTAVLLKNLRLQNLVLLTASFLFYSWGGLQYTILIVVSIVVNYILGISIGKKAESSGDGWCRRFCIMAVVFNLLLLGVFKYFNFFVDSIQSLINLFSPEFVIHAPRIPLPIGISFFTFQIMSYIIDLYKGRVRVQKNILNLALYIMLFPQLIAGPIVRYIDVADEIESRSPVREEVYQGCLRFMFGFSKKMILANKMGYAADTIFGMAQYNNTLFAWLGIICYALQIYLDFSAYSDMAIGLGKMFGFHFLENFNYPYISKSVQEFWRRWHISLSAFFRDYVYIPLGGSRAGTYKTYRNLIIVFFLTGLWHGASWNFVIWGLWYGIFLILERAGWKKWLNRLPSVVSWIYTMLIVLIGWVLFRADTLQQAWSYLTAMFSMQFGSWRQWNILILLDREMICYFILSLLLSIPLEKVWDRVDRHRIVRDICILGAFGLSLCYLMTSDFNPFIYFRF